MQAAGAQKTWRARAAPGARRRALARHLPHGERSCQLRGRQVSSHPRCAESFPLRWLELRDLRPRTADDDHPGAGVSRRRSHRAICQARRDLDDAHVTKSMDSHDRPPNDNSRRSFLLSSGGWLTGAWIASQWPAIAAAAHHADECAADVPRRRISNSLRRADAADVEAHLCADRAERRDARRPRGARRVLHRPAHCRRISPRWRRTFATGWRNFRQDSVPRNPAMASLRAAPADRANGLSENRGSHAVLRRPRAC